MLDIRQNPNLSFLQGRIKAAQLPAYTDVPLDQLGVGETISDSAFADQVARTLPCHTKAACFVSCLYFEAQKDGLDSSTRQRVSAKLASMKKLHDIADEEIEEALDPDYMDEEEKKAAIEKEANRLVTLARRDLNACDAGQLIAACRELKQAGASNSFIDDWTFSKPMKKLAYHVSAIAGGYFSPSQDEFFKKYAELTPAQQLERLPEAASKLNETMDCKTVHAKLASIPTQAQHDLRILDRDVPRNLVQSCLPKIAAMTPLEVYLPGTSLPAVNWDTIIERSGRDTQRQIMEQLGI